MGVGLRVVITQAGASRCLSETTALGYAKFAGWTDAEPGSAGWRKRPWLFPAEGTPQKAQAEKSPGLGGGREVQCLLLDHVR